MWFVKCAAVWFVKCAAVWFVKCAAVWFVKCTAVWFTMCLALRSARATFVTSNDPGGATIVHSPEYLLSFQHVDTPAPSLDIDWSDLTQNSKQNRKKKRGSRGGVRTRLKNRGCRLFLSPITLSNVHPFKTRTFTFDKV